MEKLPKSQDTLVLRTDFTNDSAWESLCTHLIRPVDDCSAYVQLHSNAQYDGITVAQILELNDTDVDNGPSFMFVVDATAIEHPEQAFLVIDLHDEPGRTFRAIPSVAGAVENNLSIGNMDFWEFADAVDADGIFRGFK
jgi:hypothetical protein